MTSSRRYSISKVAILILDIISLFWLGLWIKDIFFIGSPISRGFIYIFQGVILLYVLLFIFLKRPPFRDGKKWPSFTLDGGKVYFSHGKIELVKVDKGDPVKINKDDLEELVAAYRNNDEKIMEKFGFRDLESDDQQTQKVKKKKKNEYILFNQTIDEKGEYPSK